MATEGEAAVVPRLRFPEFREDDAWGVDALSTVADFVNKKISVSSVSTANYVSTENLLPNYGGVAEASKLPATGSVTRYQLGDVLISNIRPYLKKVWHANQDGGASNDVMVVRAKGGLSRAFLASVLKSDAFIEYVMRGAKGVKMPRGDVDSMRQYPVGHPGAAEQQKIADCLTSLDEVITAQGRKVEALKTYKRGLMQQLFPREGETLPRLRFPEFRDAPEWQKVPLGDVAEIKLGKMLDANKRKIGRLFPYVNNISLRWNDVDASNLPQMYFDDGELERYRLKAGDVLVCEGGEPGRSAVWDGRLPDLKFQKAIHRVRFNIPFEPKLLVFYLEAVAGTTEFESLFTGGGIKHLTLETFSRFKIPVMPLAEERQVVDCLSSLGAQIAVAIEEFNVLNAHKKGMMQQLFPFPEVA